MKKNIFREYDIRGIVGSELLLDEAYNLGCAIVSYLKATNPSMQSIIVCRDGRSHSAPLTRDITKAILDAGIDVIDIGGVEFGIGQCILHGTGRPSPKFIWGSDVSRIAGPTVAEDLRIDASPTGFGVLQFLEHQDSAALAEDKAVAIAIREFWAEI
mgnify:CR=1 FL=1